MALTNQAIADLKSRLPRISVKVGRRSNQEIYQALIAADIQVDDFSRGALLESRDSEKEIDLEVGIFSGEDLGFDSLVSRFDIYFAATKICKFTLLNPYDIGEIRTDFSQACGKWVMAGMKPIWDDEKNIPRIVALEKDYKGNILLRSAVGTSTRLWKPNVEWMFGLP